MMAKDTKKSIPVYDVKVAPEGFVINCNGKPIMTPAGVALSVPTKPLADVIVEEWRAQGEKIKPETMPFTQLVMTALDIISKQREAVTKALAGIAETDLLCHRAEEPVELAARQAKIWQPWLDWAQQRHGVVLKVQQGIMPIVQPREALEVLRKAVAAYDDFYLAGLQQASSVAGSLILGLALVEAQATAVDLFTASELDALYQMEKWGEDPVTTERHKSVRKDLDVCQGWFKLLRQSET